MHVAEDGRVSGSIDRAYVAQLLAETDDEELQAHYRDLLGESEEGLAAKPAGPYDEQIAKLEEKLADLKAKQAEQAEAAAEEAPAAPAEEPVVQPDEQDVVELDQLRAEAEALGVKVDKRWGADRLRSEIAAARGE